MSTPARPHLGPGGEATFAAMMTGHHAHPDHDQRLDDHDARLADHDGRISALEHDGHGELQAEGDE